MRKAIFLFFLLLGIGGGLLASYQDSWGGRVVFMVLGAVVFGLIGGALSQIGKPWRWSSRPALTEEELHPIPGGLGMSGRDLSANYWRDEGHPPHMKPPRSELGHHMFDADKWH